MRGPDEKQDWIFSYISAEKRVPKDHPLRAIRTMVDVVLKDLSLLFEGLYSKVGRASMRHAGYSISQRKRKRVEEISGWMKTIGMLCKPRHRGIARVGWMFTFGVAVYNLVSMRNMMEIPA